uniref:Uncharacterized LOC103035269 n=1 Tax=Astyanax mexicanus TaxID=7994 RepID=A0A8B9JRC3_ASTMX
MTKLQLLHRALNERLMAAVEQVMEMVGGTVLEYEVEMVRARKENEELRRRLRWMEGENPTDWPGNDEPVQNCPSITIEPINVSDLQSLIPDAKLAAAVSIRSADLEIIRPKSTEATISGISNNMGWVSSLSYMEPLDCDPTTKSGKGRSRSRRNMMSYACPDCGKVFGRKQNLNVHMRIHSADKPYAYRSRKACFYGDKKRKRKPHGLFKECVSRLWRTSQTLQRVLDQLQSANQWLLRPARDQRSEQSSMWAADARELLQEKICISAWSVKNSLRKHQSWQCT